jgi:hypothetical protein
MKIVRESNVKIDATAEKKDQVKVTVYITRGEASGSNILVFLQNDRYIESLLLTDLERDNILKAFNLNLLTH